MLPVGSTIIPPSDYHSSVPNTPNSLGSGTKDPRHTELPIPSLEPVQCLPLNDQRPARMSMVSKHVVSRPIGYSTGSSVTASTGEHYQLGHQSESSFPLAASSTSEFSGTYGTDLSPRHMSWSTPYSLSNFVSGPMLASNNVERGASLEDMQTLAASAASMSMGRVKRKKLSADERMERSRERNRIHAKKTRLRKKLKMEHLLHRKQELVDEQLRLKETIKDREAAPILLGMKNSPNGVFTGPTGEHVIDTKISYLSESKLDPKSKVRKEGGGDFDSDTEVSDESMSVHGNGASSARSVPSSTKSAEPQDRNTTTGGRGGGADDQEPSEYQELLKKDRRQLTATEFDLIRKVRNRLHAKKTRDKKKLQLEETQKEITRLEKENSRLRDEICRLGMSSHYDAPKQITLQLPLEDASRVIDQCCKVEQAAIMLHGAPRTSSISKPTSRESTALSSDIADPLALETSGIVDSPAAQTVVPSSVSRTGQSISTLATAEVGKAGERRRSPESDVSTSDSNKTTEEDCSGNGTSSGNGSSSSSGAAASDLSTSGNGNGSTSGSGNGMSDLSSSGDSQQDYGSNGSGPGDGESNSDSGSNGHGSYASHESRLGFGESNSDSGSTGGSNGYGNRDGEDSSGSHSPRNPQRATGSSGHSGSEEDEEHRDTAHMPVMDASFSSLNSS